MKAKDVNPSNFKVENVVFEMMIFYSDRYLGNGKKNGNEMEWLWMMIPDTQNYLKSSLVHG